MQSTASNLGNMSPDGRVVDHFFRGELSTAIAQERFLIRHPTEVAFQIDQVSMICCWL